MDISATKRQTWADRLDKFCVITGSLLPVGIVLGNAGFETLIALTGIMWIGRSIIARENPLPVWLRHRLVQPWLMWYGAILLTLLVNRAGVMDWANDIVYVRQLIFFVALLDVAQRRPLAAWLLKGLAAGVVLALVNTLAAHAFGHDMVGHPLCRYLGKLKEAGRISGLCTFAGPFFLGWGLLDRTLTGRRKMFVLLVGATALALVGYFHIRTAFLAVCAGVGLLGVYACRRRFSVTTLLTLGAVLLVAAALIMQYKRLLDLKNFYARIYIWQVSWKIWLDQPLFGASVSGYRDVFARVASSGRVADLVTPTGIVYSGARGYVAYHAHNLFLMLLATTGVTGFFSFLWLYGRCAVASMQNRSGWRQGLMTWPLVFFVVGLASWNIYDSFYLSLTAFFMVLIGVDGSPDNI